jgi:hypothetical protein
LRVDEQELSREELVEKLQSLGPEIRDMWAEFRPWDVDWDPLERVLPLEQCAGFMFMGHDGDIRMYKHGITRRYLLIDSRAYCYRYRAYAKKKYTRISRKDAIAWVFEDIEKMNATPETPYDDDYIAKKHKALAEAGWTMVGAPAPEEAI